MAFHGKFIDRAGSTQFEQLGTKPKFWYDGGRWLFRRRSRDGSRLG